MQQALLVFVGSGLGGMSRYLLGRGIGLLLPGPFPTGTVTINITGSFLIALVNGIAAQSSWISADLRLFLTTGIMGGYTTYSSFNFETLSLVQAGHPGLGALNLLGTVVTCLLAGLAGFAVARVITAS